MNCRARALGEPTQGSLAYLAGPVGDHSVVDVELASRSGYAFQS